MAIGQLGMMGLNALGSVAQDIVGNSRSRKNIKDYLQWQTEANKEMTEFNKEQQLDLWNKTNAAAQRKHLEDAGLNVGLMYEGTGAGGATASLATGSANAPSGKSDTKSLDLAQAASIGQQLKNQEAQEELLRAQTAKTNAETEKIGGADTSESVSRFKLNMQELQEKQISQDARMSEIESQAKTAMNEVRKSGAEANVSEETQEAEINRIRTESIGAMLKNTLIKTDVNLKSEQMKEINARIEKMSEDIEANWTKLGIEEQRNKIQQFAEELKAKYPNVMNVAGGRIDQMLTAIFKMTGGSDFLRTQTEKME